MKIVRIAKSRLILKNNMTIIYIFLIIITIGIIEIIKKLSAIRSDCISMYNQIVDIKNESKKAPPELEDYHQ